MKILFCTDGSKISYEALSNSLDWFKSSVTDMLCVADWSFLPDTLSAEGTDFAVKCANSTESVLDFCEKFLKENNYITGRKIKMCGVPIDAILDVENDENYDVIVSGSNGKKGFRKWLGSVSQELAASAKTSTYISKGVNNRNKVLFTLDASELSKNVVTKSIEMMNLEDKEVTLLSVYEIPEYLFLEGNIDSNWVTDIERKQKHESLILLEKYKKLFEAKNIKVHSKSALKGNPSEVILKYASKNGTDLIVCGIRSKKYYSRFFFGSVSKRVLENTQSDVLIIRP